MASVLTNADRARRSLSFGSEQGERPHSLTREVSDLRNDIELAFNRIEGGDDLPELLVFPADSHDKNNNKVKLVDGKKILGRNLLAGRAQALVRIGDITYSAILPGTAGNSLAVKIEQGAGALAATIANDVITITLAAGGSTNDQIAAEVNADHALKIRANVEQNGGVNAAVAAQQSLAGGTGEGLQLIASSIDANGSLGEIDASDIIAEVADTYIMFGADKDISITAKATGDIMSLSLLSHTARSTISFAAK